VWTELDQLHRERGVDLVVAGGQRGVDTFAETWARSHRIPCMVFPEPSPGPHGESSGPLRNGWMLKYGRPDLVLAFPGGVGTADMVRQAQAAEVEVLRAQ